MIPTVVQGDMYVAGTLSAKNVTLPSGAINNSSIAADAGIAANKLQHQHRVHFAQPDTAAAAETRAVYRCYGQTGTLVGVYVGSIGICTGDATVTVDVRKNGVTMLNTVVTLSSGNAARVGVAGNIAVSSLVAGDLVEIVVTPNAGTGSLGTGLFASLTIHEDAA